MGNRQNQLIMLKLHLFPWESGKDAVLGPLKLPSGFALGQFWRPSDGIFSRIPRKKGGVLAHIVREFRISSHKFCSRM